MARKDTESWAEYAQHVLAQTKHHTGAARQALLELLDSQTCALSAIEIEDALRERDRAIGRASIYRILDELERLHLVQKLQVGQAMARYEPIRTGKDHHHHLVCDNCGTVTPFTDPDLETAIKNLERRVPMRVDEHEIVLHGACQDCSDTGGLVTTTGIAGFTLGGGIGWMMRKHGLACDNLISADLVTADGQTVAMSETENAELLWGLRGGGGNFGLVTEFEYRLHPVSQVLGGLVAWPAQAAGDVLRFWRDWVRDTPDDLCTMAAFLYAPPEPFVPPEVVGAPIFAIACCHLDPEGTAEDDLRPPRDLEPAVDVLGPMPYAVIQGMFDAGVPRGSRNYWRSGYVNTLSDEAIEAILAASAGVPAPPASRPPAGRGDEPRARRSDGVRQP